ncbi:hypothetical protein TIFTF001_019455 [Ficus carica]|uniref:Receptor-like serine/threonine-protein kinase n=1 Tax=Ficus carica TaxID=3494 RepID=A0AA88ABR1_FICCA|nr:hypothetical protein TIFTF001_019455 [Ficus carica]
MVPKVEAPNGAVFSSIILSYFFIGWASMTCQALQAQRETDTIRAGQVLRYSEQLMASADGKFQLGFFNLSDPPNGYLGIWYTDDSRKTKVWVANRETPVSGGNAYLTLDTNDGVLKIMHDGGNPIALNRNRNPNLNGTARSSVATLENSGNLVLKEVSIDGKTEQVLWESFDHPTDTLLPGMKLGTNYVPGKTWKLTSWLSEQVPSSGSFSLECFGSSFEKKGYLVISLRQDGYWKTRVWGNKVEDIERENTNDNVYNFSYVNNYNDFLQKKNNYNDSEIYFTYTTSSVWPFPMLRLSPRGTLLDSYDSPLFRGGNACYGYGYTSETGCSVPPQLLEESFDQCKSSRKVTSFSQLDGSFGPVSYQDENSSIGYSDCWYRCWSNCSCVGFVLYHTNGTGCKFWNGAEFQRGYGEVYHDANILASALLGNINGHSSEDKEEKEEQSILNELTTLDRLKNAEELGNDGKKGHDLKLFSFDSIMAATDNFSTEKKLGQGGFGPVFKGKLPEGQEIAVKRLSMSSGQGLLEFKNELILIAKLQHMNLVRLLGCCVKGAEKMLIYEYMPNKSLDFFLFDASRRELLDWKKRYHIIEGIAQGLLYLHKYSRLRVIHRDLKASNILLTNDMSPKISDFGMARIFGRNESEANTNRVVGTYGYMSPEYAMEGNFSEKSDVYSFGVLLLEIVSGRRNTGFYNPERPLNLVGYSWELWKEGRNMELIDSNLADQSTRTQIARCIHVALLCVQDNAADRPTMVDALPMITNQSVSLPLPKQVTIPFQRQMKEANTNKRNQEISLVTVSITDMEPR